MRWSLGHCSYIIITTYDAIRVAIESYIQQLKSCKLELYVIGLVNNDMI